MTTKPPSTPNTYPHSDPAFQKAAEETLARRKEDEEASDQFLQAMAKKLQSNAQSSAPNDLQKRINLAKAELRSLISKSIDQAHESDYLGTSDSDLQSIIDILDGKE